MKMKNLEAEYGEDVADFCYELEKFSQGLDNGYLDIGESANALYIYWGDQDVKNVYVILKEDVQNVRTFSNEYPEYKVEHLFDLIKRIQAD
jgi:hypothetical protein